MLNRPGEDFTGGELVLVEQRPRAQSRAHVVPLRQGAFLLFPTRHRPVPATRGAYRATLRHGVSTVHTGRAPDARDHLPRRRLRCLAP